jgi:hypothetical protein
MKQYVISVGYLRGGELEAYVIGVEIPPRRELEAYVIGVEIPPRRELEAYVIGVEIPPRRELEAYVIGVEILWRRQAWRCALKMGGRCCEHTHRCHAFGLNISAVSNRWRGLANVDRVRCHEPQVVHCFLLGAQVH